MNTELRKQSTFRAGIYRRAVLESFSKLNPRWMVRNPVMFVVEVGSVLTTALWVEGLAGKRRGAYGIHRSHRAVAMVHRAVCELFRSRGGRPRQGTGRCIAQGAAGYSSQTPARPGAEHGIGAGENASRFIDRAQEERSLPGGGRRPAAGGRRDHDGDRVGGRERGDR